MNIGGDRTCEPIIELGRIFGVAIGLHYSWIIIALLGTLSLRSQIRGCITKRTSQQCIELPF